MTVAGLLGLALLAPTTAASAAGETCQGRTATLVGTPGASIRGTEGPDVVVTSGAYSVDALGGDDLVCVTAGTETFVSTGVGNDVVDATQPGPATLVVTLGDGDDTFVGAAPELSVHAGSSSGDSGADDVHVTAVDGASALIDSGQAGVANGDRVHLAGTGDVRWRGAMAPGAALVGGTDRNHLEADLPAGGVTVDLRRGVATAGSDVLHWSGFESFRFDDTQGTTTSVDLTGTAGDDEVDLYLLGPATRVRASMGKGRDVLGTTSLATGNHYRGGQGRDLIGVVAWGDLGVDLDRGVLSQRLEGTVRRSSATSFEDVSVWGRRAEVVGDAGDNTITVGGCRRSVAAGRGGDDVITYDGDIAFDGRTCNSAPGARFTGGSGDDVLVGGVGDDTLIGGRGRDQADGRAGTDRCVAERAQDCER
ncbi:hypothetical protein L2K70_10125 [Nocardioides KLBMP 9356]|uniref:Calcium-binding protein n=1 Tax=Nocardioides potassii TaxID=2911371 RepID=A0ABS9HD21_9ACTN|nr:hypothetical protein [Nocardioides potassii]MCF6377963.1 hypothetical protein [Nocardioides potassii]